MDQNPIKKTPTPVIIAALREIANNGIQTDDGVINACLFEAAARMEEMYSAIKQTLEDNAHLADGDTCTLCQLRVAIGTD